MGGKAIGTVKALYLDLNGECQDQEVGVGGVVSRDSGEAMGSFCGGGTRKEDRIWNVNEENI